MLWLCLEHAGDESSGTEARNPGPTVRRTAEAVATARQIVDHFLLGSRIEAVLGIRQKVCLFATRNSYWRGANADITGFAWYSQNVKDYFLGWASKRGVLSLR